MIFFANSSTRFTELQNIIDWLIWSCTKTTRIEGHVSYITYDGTKMTSQIKIIKWYICVNQQNLGKEGVKTVNFLSFFNKCVELCNSLQCKFIHKVNHVRFRQIFVLELLNSHRECCWKHQNLSASREVANQLFHGRLKLRREKLVCLENKKSIILGKGQDLRTESQ